MMGFLRTDRDLGTRIIGEILVDLGAGHLQLMPKVIKAIKEETLRIKVDPIKGTQNQQKHQPLVLIRHSILFYVCKYT